MNKTKLIEKAKMLLEQYEELQANQRNYDHQNWHAVDVKRYSDQVDIEELAKKHPKKYRDVIIDKFDSNDEAFSQLYWEWLRQEWDQLNYEISDINAITEGAKDEHKAFDFITKQRQGSNITGSDTYIYALGRPSGWACFQDDINIDDIEYFLENSNDAGWDLEEIENQLNDLAQAIKEIDYIKNYIIDFNNSINFEEYLKDQIEQLIQEEEDKKGDYRTLRDNFEGINSQVIQLLAVYSDDKKLNSSITRNLKSILSLVNKKIQK